MKNVFSALMLFLIITGCEHRTEIDNMNLMVSYSVRSTVVDVKLTNSSSEHYMFYDSLNVADQSFPHFMWYRVCEIDGKDIDEMPWLSAHKMTSSIISVPVKLSSISPKESITKSFDFEKHIAQESLKSNSDNLGFQFKMEIFNDENLSSSNNYISNCVLFYP